MRPCPPAGFHGLFWFIQRLPVDTPQVGCLRGRGPRPRLQAGPQDRRAGPHLPSFCRGLEGPESRHRQCLPPSFRGAGSCPPGPWAGVGHAGKRNCQQAGAWGRRPRGPVPSGGAACRLRASARTQRLSLWVQTPAGPCGGTGSPLLAPDLRQALRRARGWSGEETRPQAGSGQSASPREVPAVPPAPARRWRGRRVGKSAFRAETDRLALSSRIPLPLCKLAVSGCSPVGRTRGHARKARGHTGQQAAALVKSWERNCAGRWELPFSVLLFAAPGSSRKTDNEVTEKPSMRRLFGRKIAIGKIVRYLSLM